VTSLIKGQLSGLKARKPQSAEQSIQMVESLVAESAVDPMESNNANLNVNMKKRRFEEINDDNHVKVKTERSLSGDSNISATTNGSEMKVEPVDEETTNAASILNGVSMDHRPVLPLSISLTYVD
jgi:hypothetical protein